jgi:hypothetical protein
MEDIIDIIVTETTNTIEITSQVTDEIIDVNIIDNREDIVLNVTPTVVEININSLTGNFGVTWGEITGTLSNQTDLNTALGLKADLVGGKVPSSQLPSYVDDVVEVANYAALPATGETGKIYVVLDTNKIYRWSGSAYVEIADSTAVWGAITGTLSSQTDLQNALNAKFDDPTGDTTQYIAGDGSLITFPVAGQAGTLVREVRNTTGATLTKGTIVYISGATGNKPTVSKAIATGDSTSAQTFGMCQANIANNSNGYVVCVGDITGLDTSALTEGAQLYLSSTTAGTYTTTKQLAPAHLVYIGIVTRAHPTQGQIEVKIQNGYELDEIHDVAISSVANNDGLFYESSTNLWKNKSIATVLGYTPANGADYLPLTGGTMTGALNGTSANFTGDLTINSTNPRIYLTDSDNNPDYFISNTDGTFTVYDVTNSTARFTIGTTGNATFANAIIGGGSITGQSIYSNGIISANGAVFANGADFRMTSGGLAAIGLVLSSNYDVISNPKSVYTSYGQSAVLGGHEFRHLNGSGTGLITSAYANPSGNWNFYYPTYFTNNYSATNSMQIISQGNIAGFNTITTGGNGSFALLSNYIATNVTSFLVGTNSSAPSIEAIRIANATGALTLVSSLTGTSATLSGDLSVTGTNGNITIPLPVDYLVVGGGGGGGADLGGGGGAGGFLAGTTYLTKGTFSVVQVGNGGRGSGNSGNSRIAENGGNSSLFHIVAYGGGGGACNINRGLPGASGGGGSREAYLGGTTLYPNQGFAGGAGGTGSPYYVGGGGGGADGAGGSGSTQTGGNGGIGKVSDISGTATYYAGGGGGCGYGGGGGTGGLGGGGNGSSGSSGNTAGTANTGGGGGGGGNITGTEGSNGGSGIVIIKYADTYPTSTCTGTYSYSVSGGFRRYTFTGNGTIKLMA